MYCCQVRLAAVEPGAAATIAAIRSLQPYTMSWSNVPDYIEPAAFHRLARAVSDEVAGTVHFMHSMNWVQELKGAFDVDYMSEIAEEFLPQVMGIVGGARDVMQPQVAVHAGQRLSGHT
jgi:hypothetical protein